jgi:hypothetical protein
VDIAKEKCEEAASRVTILPPKSVGLEKFPGIESAVRRRKHERGAVLYSNTCKTLKKRENEYRTTVDQPAYQPPGATLASSVSRCGMSGSLMSNA